MNDNTRKALETLKQATLRLLYEQRPFMRQGEVSEQLSIPRIEAGKHTHSLAHGILIQLWGDESAEYIGRNQWEITEKGISTIR